MYSANSSCGVRPWRTVAVATGGDRRLDAHVDDPLAEALRGPPGPARRGAARAPPAATRRRRRPPSRRADPACRCRCAARRPARSSTGVTLAGSPGSSSTTLTCLRSLVSPKSSCSGRAAVVDGRGAGDLLGAVQVPERDVPRGRRERRAEDGVLLHQVGGPLAAAGGATVDERVGDEHVDRVGRERRAQRPDQLVHALRRTPGPARTRPSTSTARRGRCPAWTRTGQRDVDRSPRRGRRSDARRRRRDGAGRRRRRRRCGRTAG